MENKTESTDISCQKVTRARAFFDSFRHSITEAYEKTPPELVLSQKIFWGYLVKKGYLDKNPADYRTGTSDRLGAVQTAYNLMVEISSGASDRNYSTKDYPIFRIKKTNGSFVVQHASVYESRKPLEHLERTTKFIRNRDKKVKQHQRDMDKHADMVSPQTMAELQSVQKGIEIIFRHLDGVTNDSFVTFSRELEKAKTLKGRSKHIG